MNTITNAINDAISKQVRAIENIESDREDLLNRLSILQNQLTLIKADKAKLESEFRSLMDSHYRQVGNYGATDTCSANPDKNTSN